jgi:hypothetical protein
MATGHGLAGEEIDMRPGILVAELPGQGIVPDEIEPRSEQNA